MYSLIFDIFSVVHSMTWIFHKDNIIVHVPFEEVPCSNDITAVWIPFFAFQFRCPLVVPLHTVDLLTFYFLEDRLSHDDLYVL